MENASFASADQEIIGYMNRSFTPECRRVLTNAVAVLYHVEYPDLQSSLVELLNGPDSEDTDALSESFSVVIHDALVNYLRLLGIEVIADADLEVLVHIATALEIVTTIEDPVPFLRLLETDNTADVKLSRLVSEITGYNDLAVLDTLHHVETTVLSRLAVQLEKLELRIPTTEEELNTEALIDNLKHYKEYKGGDGIGYSMLDFGFKPGGLLENYYPYINDVLDAGEPETTANNLLSFFYLTSDAWKTPVETYRKDAERYVRDPKHIPLVEQSMRRITESFDQYKRTLNEPK